MYGVNLELNEFNYISFWMTVAFYENPATVKSKFDIKLVLQWHKT